MSALPQHGQFETAADQPFFIVATLWRGAMVERFARVEFFVDRSLAACARVGIQPADTCCDRLPRKRIAALLASLADERLAAHSETARVTLSGIENCWQDRNALCHGRMRVLKQSVRIDWTAFESGRRVPRELRLAGTEMLGILGAMDRAQMVLGSQLGAIDKRCAELAAPS